MNTNRQPSDVVSLLEYKEATAVNASPLKTTGIRPQNHTSVLALVQTVGAFANTETCTILLVKSASSALSTPTTLKTISLVADATTNDDTCYMLDWTSEEHDEDLPYIGVIVTPSSTGGGLFAVSMLGMNVRHGSATRHNSDDLGSTSSVPTTGIGT